MKSFLNVIRKHYAEVPNLIWLTLYSEGTLTSYTIQDLYKCTNNYIHFYDSQSLQSGELVVIILKESLDLFASFFAAILCGLKPAFLAYPSEKQSNESFLAGLSILHGYNKISQLITIEEVTDVIRIDNRFDDINIQTTELLIINELDKIKGLTHSDESFLQFSSGTTGIKKGVEISSESFFNQIEAYSEFLEIDNHSKIISWLPHYHDMGLIACMLMPFTLKIPIIMMSPFEWVARPELLLSLISELSPTHVWLPNFALGHLNRNISNPNDYDLSSIKLLTCCSEPLLKTTYEKFIATFAKAGLDPQSVNNCYAMAENTFAMTATRKGNIAFVELNKSRVNPDNYISNIPVASAGKPLPNINVKIVNSNGEVKSEKIIGEIHIKSNCLFDSYYMNPEATTSCFQNEYFKTGDLGFWKNDELFIVGRDKDIIIVAGENIYPYDIELVLNEYEGLIPGRNVVFGIYDTINSTEKIVAIAESHDQLSNDEISDIKKTIYVLTNWVINDIYILPHMSLIKGTAGKISRYLNREAFLNGDFNNHFLSNAVSDDTLNAIIGDLIPRNLINTKPDKENYLFSSGFLDSLGFASLVLRIENLFNIKVPDEYLKYQYFDSPEIIQNTVNSIKNRQNVSTESFSDEREFNLQSFLDNKDDDKHTYYFLESLINNFPFKNSMVFTFLFKLIGIKIGTNVKFLGNIKIKIRGKPENIQIGNNVILGAGIDFRNRENGKIILEDNVYCDVNVRLVAAREGKIFLGKGTEIGAGSVINSGGTFITGKYCMIAGNVNINSSSHGIAKNNFIKIQPHDHGDISLGDDVWIGSGASILMNSSIGDGAVISANSLVSGNIPDFAVCAGVPVKIIRYRE